MNSELFIQKKGLHKFNNNPSETVRLNVGKYGTSLNDNRSAAIIQKKQLEAISKKNISSPFQSKANTEMEPTMQMKDKVNVNDDFALEKEADVMGEKALQMRQVNKSVIQKSKSIGSGIVQRVPQWIRRAAGGVASLAGAAGGAVLGGIRGAYDGAMNRNDEGEQGIISTIFSPVTEPVTGAVMGAITGARKGLNRPVGMGTGATVGSAIGGLTVGKLAGGVAGGLVSTAGKFIGGVIGHTVAGATSLGAGALGAVAGLAGGAITGYRQDGLVGAALGGITGATLGGAAGLAAGYIGPVAAGALAGGALGALVGNIADERRLREENVRHQVQAPLPASHRIPGRSHITYTRGYITYNNTHYQVGKKMVADLWADDPVHGSATGDNWPWMQALNNDRRYNGAKIVRGHLLNHDLGGIAKPENLYPISTIANVAHSVQVEQNVKRLLSEESVKGINEKHVHYEVVVDETTNHDPSQAAFVCSYSVEGGEHRAGIRIASDLGQHRGGFGGGTKINPLSGTDWHHGKRRGFQDRDWQKYLTSGRVEVDSEAPPPRGEPIVYPEERNNRRRGRRRN